MIYIVILIYYIVTSLQIKADLQIKIIYIYRKNELFFKFIFKNIFIFYCDLIGNWLQVYNSLLPLLMFSSLNFFI